VRSGAHTGSTWHVGHFWAIVPAPGDGDDGEFGGMKIEKGNRSTRRKSAPAPLCPPQISPANPGRRGEKAATNRLSYGAHETSSSSHNSYPCSRELSVRNVIYTLWRWFVTFEIVVFKRVNYCMTYLLSACTFLCVLSSRSAVSKALHFLRNL
jgi:hypothetical protein